MKILENSSITLAIAVLAAFIFPAVSIKLKFLLTPVLIIMMTLSLKEINFRKITKSKYKSAAKLTLMNYLLLPLLILLAMLFIKDPYYRIGFVLFAAIPPAIGIVPLAFLHKSDMDSTMVAQIISYLAAFIILPAALFLLQNIVNTTLIIKSLVLFLVVPLVLSRFIHPIKHKIFSHNKLFVNLFYSLLFFLIIGSNYEIIKAEFSSLIPMFFIMILLSFGLGTIIFFINTKRNINIDQNILYVLFGTFKNTAMGAVLAIIIFNNKAAIPLIVRAIISPFYIVYINFLVSKINRRYIN